MNLAGKTFVITGASRGIGHATAVLFAQRRAKVILVARNLEKLTEISHSLPGTGHAVESFDFSSPEELPCWLKAVAERHGPLHGLVHAAGIQQIKPVRVLSFTDIQAILTVNVSSSLLLAKAFRQRGVRHSDACCSLVYISSVAGFVGEAARASYAASKSAVIGMTKSLAVEFARENIRVNCVAPAFVETEMLEEMQAQLSPAQMLAIRQRHLLGFGKPLDVANAIAFLSSDASQWITGTTLVVDGGYSAN